MKNIVIQGWMVAIAVFVLLFGGIYLTIGTGHWSTSRTAEPMKLESGEYSIADIRGSYTFAEIEQFFGVPVNLLFDAFIVPEERRSDTFMIKDMHEDFFEPVVLNGTEIEVGTDLVRVITSIYSGLPYESEETTHLPETAVNLLIQAQKLQGEQKAYWETHTFKLALLGEQPAEEQLTDSTPIVQPEEQPVSEEQPAAEEHKESQDSIEIKGSTKIGDLRNAGLTDEQFNEITGLDMPADDAIKLKDFADSNGLDMETIKTAIIETLQ